MTLYLKLALAAAALAILWGLYHFIEKSGYERRVAEENVEIIQAAADNDKLKTELQQEKTNAENALNVLLSRKPDRVRLPASPCQTNPSGGVEQAIESNRLLLEQTESILSAGRQRIAGIVGEAEQELIECRVSKDWANSLR